VVLLPTPRFMATWGEGLTNRARRGVTDQRGRRPHEAAASLSMKECVPSKRSRHGHDQRGQYGANEVGAGTALATGV
jgi:hypothetical protein